MIRPFLDASNSKINALHCGFQWFERHATSFYGPGGPMALAGNIFHAAVGDAVHGYIPKLVRANRKRSYEMWHDSCVWAMTGHPDWVTNTLDVPMANFYKSFILDRKSPIHLTEATFAVNRQYDPVEIERDSATNEIINLAEDVIVGKPDYVSISKRGDELWLADWKSGWTPVQADAGESDLQLGLYAALLCWHYPKVKGVNVYKWGVRYGEMGKSIPHYWSRQSCTEAAAGRIEKYFTKLDFLYENLPDGPWPAQPDNAATCRWCPVCTQCPLNQADWRVLELAPIITVPRRKTQRV